MRILYLVYAPQNSFQEFCKNAKTNFSWVDSLLDKLNENQSLSIALAVPINSKVFEKKEKDKIMLYGLPNPYSNNRFKKTYNRILRKIENEKINLYVNQAITDFTPDIIQIFGSENPFGLIIKQQRLPVILHIQGYLSSCVAKWFSGISKWRQFRYSSLQEVLRLRGLYYDFFILEKRAKREALILRNCKYYIGRTDFDKDMTSLFAPDGEYYCCEEMIRSEFFEKEWTPLNDNERVVLISTLNGMPYKGIELLLETSMILSQYLSIPFEFRICGVSKNEKTVKLLKKIYKNRCDFSKIIFLGRLSANELITHLCAANLYIHPSHIENSPNSVCEAMTLGMPVISTNVGGVSSVLNDKTEGLLVQEGDPDSLAEAIFKLIKEKEYAKTLGRNAKNRAIKRHDPNRIANDILNIYSSVVTKSNKVN